MPLLSPWGGRWGNTRSIISIIVQGPSLEAGPSPEGATRVWYMSATFTMFRLVSLVCRRWQRTRPSCFVQEQLHYQLEPTARSNGTVNTSDTASSPDVGIPQLFDDQRLRRTSAGNEKTDMTEMYGTRRRIMERFYRLLKTCELVMVVTELVSIVFLWLIVSRSPRAELDRPGWQTKFLVKLIALGHTND